EPIPGVEPRAEHSWAEYALDHHLQCLGAAGERVGETRALAAVTVGERYVNHVHTSRARPPATAGERHVEEQGADSRDRHAALLTAARAPSRVAPPGSQLRALDRGLPVPAAVRAPGQAGPFGPRCALRVRRCASRSRRGWCLPPCAGCSPGPWAPPRTPLRPRPSSACPGPRT